MPGSRRPALLPISAIVPQIDNAGLAGERLDWPSVTAMPRQKCKWLDNSRGWGGIQPPGAFPDNLHYGHCNARPACRPREKDDEDDHEILRLLVCVSLCERHCTRLRNRAGRSTEGSA